MRRDEGYLLDILIAARKALRFVEEGEASARISKEFRKAHSEIPWREMVGLRNRLIHEYFRVDFGAVWDTIHKDLPKLIEIIEPLVPKEDEI